MSDVDIWEQAYKSMNLSENIQFVSRGRLITEASQVEMFNKIQALLNADGMESCHKWLYEKDPTELTEAEATKINNLYKLGCERGLIDDPNVVEEPIENSEVEEPIATPAVEPTPVIPTAAYTILYSAMRNGEIKSGEAYSNSINPRSAKADVMSQLERAGYNNIKILAIECGDPDQCGNTACSNTFCKQPEVAVDTPEIPDYSEETDTSFTFEADDNKDKKDTKTDDTKTDDTKTAKQADDSNQEVKSDKSDEDTVSDDKDSEEKDTKKKEDVKKKEDAEEPDEKLKDDTEEKAEKASDKEKEDKELSPEEKATLKDSYKKAFKAAMLKCKFEELSFDDLSLEQKVDFFTELSKAWGNKADPSKFMSDKETEQLESIVVKK